MPELAELSEGIAENMEGWTFSGVDGYSRHASFSGPGGCGFRISGDGYDWGSSERVTVYGTWPEPVKDTGGNTTQFHPYHDRPGITAAIGRGAAAIAGDIKHRFLPDYLPLWDAKVEERARHIETMKGEEEALQRLGEAFGVEPSNGKIYISYRGLWGNVRVSGYSGMSATMELRSVPIDQAVQIMEILRGTP